MLDYIYHMTLNLLLEIAVFYDFAIYTQLYRVSPYPMLLNM